MTPDRRFLTARLRLILGAPLLAAVLAGCDTDSRWHLVVEDGAECPTVAEVNDLYMPESPRCGGTQVVMVTDFVGSGDYQDPWALWDTADTGSPTQDYCEYEAIRRETIRMRGCIEGRPLRQDGEARVAEVRTGHSGSPWVAGDHPAVAHLSEAERAAVGRFWLTAALYEHASIGSFSAFALDLLAHGAPPELLDRAQQAAGDEIRHARACFTLASACAGRTLAPGALRARPEPAASLADLAESVARDAAINETLAAVQAAEQLARATDPVVRAVLATIVADEARHAELAWATLRWALAAGGDEVRTRLVEVFAEATAPTLADHPEVAVPSHGVLGRDALRAALEGALTHVVGPAAAALLG